MNRRLGLILGAVVAFGAPCTAQAPARLIAEARVQIGLLEGDSAFALLVVALGQPTTSAEKLRGFTLMGITQLMRNNQAAARQTFEQALRIDPALIIDSIADLHSDAKLVFEQARTVVGPAPPPRAIEAPRVALQLTVPPSADTVLSYDDARLLIAVQTNAPSKIVSTVVATDQPNRIIWADTQATAGRLSVAIPLRGAGSDVWAVGSYALRMQAVDSTGRSTPFVERTVRLLRVAVDTQTHPPLLTAASFAPETPVIGKRSARVLLSGGSLAAIVAAMPIVFGNRSLNAGLSSDPTSYAVAGGVALASVIGFIKGRAPNQVPADVILKNRQLRDNDQRQRAEIARANAAARLRAPIRVTMDKS